MSPVVRIPEAGTGILKQYLDSGIQNIIIPKVESGEEVEQIMYWASYAPRGNCGMGADTQFLVQAADTTLATFKFSIGK